MHILSLRPRAAANILALIIPLFAPLLLRAQAPAAPSTVPDWAQPGSATHTQIAPPPDFHRPTKTFNTPIGIFEGQPHIGAPLVPGSASYAPAAKQYTINSAGYNVWY